MAARWKVDAPGERARRFASLATAAAWVRALIERGAVVTVEEIGGWAKFTLSPDGKRTRISGRYSWMQMDQLCRAIGRKFDA